MQKDLYSITEVAELLGLHVKTVRNYVRDGRLNSTRIGKQYRISRTDLENFTGTSISPTSTLRVPRALEVSSTVQIESINPTDSSRISNALVAAAKGNQEEQPLRVDALYYPDKDRLKVFITGSVDATTVILKMVKHLAAA